MAFACLLTSSLNLNLTLNVPKVWKFRSYNVFMLRHWCRHFLLVFWGLSCFVSRGILDFPLFLTPLYPNPSVIPFFFFRKYSSYFPFLKSFDRVISHVSFLSNSIWKSLGHLWAAAAFLGGKRGELIVLESKTGDLITITSYTAALALLLTLFLIVLLSTKRLPL